jgi:hypothetical protein
MPNLGRAWKASSVQLPGDGGRGQDRSRRGTLTVQSPVQNTLMGVAKITQVSVLKVPKPKIDKFTASGSKLKASKVNLAQMPVTNRFSLVRNDDACDEARMARTQSTSHD